MPDRYFTSSHAASGFFVPFQMANPSVEPNAVRPFGPFGTAAYAQPKFLVDCRRIGEGVEAVLDHRNLARRERRRDRVEGTLPDAHDVRLIAHRFIIEDELAAPFERGEGFLTIESRLRVVVRVHEGAAPCTEFVPPATEFRGTEKQPHGAVLRQLACSIGVRVLIPCVVNATEARFVEQIEGCSTLQPC